MIELTMPELELVAGGEGGGTVSSSGGRTGSTDDSTDRGGGTVSSSGG
jgi:hypothetical protein